MYYVFVIALDCSVIFRYFLSCFLHDGMVMKSGILTVKEVAEYLKLNEKTTYRLTAEGKLPGFKVGGSWRFREIDVNRWIVAQFRIDEGSK